MFRYHKEVPVDALIDYNFVVDGYRGCEHFVFGITIVLIWGDVGQPNVGLAIDFYIEKFLLYFVSDSNFELKFSANQNDWPHSSFVQLLAFDCGAFLTKLDLCELGQFVV